MRRPPRNDVLLALAFTAALLVEQAVARSIGPEDALVVAGGLALAWRRAQPVLSTVVLNACFGVTEFIEGDNTDAFTLFAAIVFSLYSAAAYARRDRLVAGVAVSCALVSVTAAEAGLNDPEFSDSASAISGGVLFALLVVCAPAVLIGLGVRRQTALKRRLEQQAHELETERDRHAGAAALEERARMAHSLHAVAAESVRVMLDDLAVARACALSDPDRADGAMLRVEERGRDALGEMRALLGVLRRGDEDLALAPQPSLARLDALVRQTGPEVSLAIEGEPRPLTPGLDVAAYRVVEEALAVAPDGVPADVLVRWSARHLELVVSVDGPALADDGALAATRERVALFGGRLAAGRRPGGSAMRAELPAGAAP